FDTELAQSKLTVQDFLKRRHPAKMIWPLKSLRVVMGWQARWTPGTFPGLCATSAATTFWQRRIRPREACVVCESGLRISEVRQSLAQKQNFRERGRDSK